jgi:arylsulfatase A-like enzyme
MIKHPKVGVPVRIDTVVSLLDLGATIYEMLDVTPPPGIHSRSLIPVLKGEKYFRKYLFGKNDQDEYVRYGKWKLINKPRGYYELYDLEVDPQELKDVAREYPQTVSELKARLLEHKIQMSRYND